MPTATQDILKYLISKPRHKLIGCIYFPESDTIFHRASIVSNRDSDGVPADDVKLRTLRLVCSESSNMDGESKA